MKDYDDSDIKDAILDYLSFVPEEFKPSEGDSGDYDHDTDEMYTN